jgi:hypothetical protein
MQHLINTSTKDFLIEIRITADEKIFFTNVFIYAVYLFRSLMVRTGEKGDISGRRHWLEEPIKASMRSSQGVTQRKMFINNK